MVVLCRCSFGHDGAWNGRLPPRGGRSQREGFRRGEESRGRGRGRGRGSGRWCITTPPVYFCSRHTHSISPMSLISMLQRPSDLPENNIADGDDMLWVRATRRPTQVSSPTWISLTLPFSLPPIRARMQRRSRRSVWDLDLCLSFCLASRLVDRLTVAGPRSRCRRICAALRSRSRSPASIPGGGGQVWSWPSFCRTKEARKSQDARAG